MPALRDAVPTETFLLPGQQLSVGVPWERDARPPPRFIKPVIPSKGNTLDTKGQLESDVVSGLYIGDCQVIRKLVPGNADHLLALRDTEDEGMVPVVLRRLEIPEAFANELAGYADWASRLEHGNLARVFPCEVTDEGIFWVTELVSGATLAEISDACVRAGKSVPVGIALAAVHEAALGLGELHAPPGEAHALLCDQSLVVGFDGGARLLDVGLFRALQHQTLWPEVMDRIGPYLAPEQVLRGHLPDPRSDVFSLAALLHAFLSGGRTPAQLTFDQRAQRHRDGGFPPPSSLNIALSAKVDDVVMKALSQNPSDRYRTAVEFADALKAAASDLFWRKELRAQFVGSLFSDRKRREAVLFAATAHEAKDNALPRPPPAPRRSRTPIMVRPPPLPPKRVKTSLKIQKKQYLLARPSPNIITRQERIISEPVAFAESYEEWDDDEQRSLRPWVLTLIAASLALFLLQGPKLYDLEDTAPVAAASVESLVRAQIFATPWGAPAPYFGPKPALTRAAEPVAVKVPEVVALVPVAAAQVVEAAPVVPAEPTVAASIEPPQPKAKLQTSKLKKKHADARGKRHARQARTKSTGR